MPREDFINKLTNALLPLIFDMVLGLTLNNRGFLFRSTLLEWNALALVCKKWNPQWWTSRIFVTMHGSDVVKFEKFPQLKSLHIIYEHKPNIHFPLTVDKPFLMSPENKLRKLTLEYYEMDHIQKLFFPCLEKARFYNCTRTLPTFSLHFAPNLCALKIKSVQFSKHLLTICNAGSKCRKLTFESSGVISFTPTPKIEVVRLDPFSSHLLDTIVCCTGLRHLELTLWVHQTSNLSRLRNLTTLILTCHLHTNDTNQQSVHDFIAVNACTLNHLNISFNISFMSDVHEQHVSFPPFTSLQTLKMYNPSDSFLTAISDSVKSSLTIFKLKYPEGRRPKFENSWKFLDGKSMRRVSLHRLPIEQLRKLPRMYEVRKVTYTHPIWDDWRDWKKFRLQDIDFKLSDFCDFADDEELTIWSKFNPFFPFLLYGTKLCPFLLYGTKL